MLTPARIAPALIGLALAAAPASVQAQAPPHTHNANCPACAAAKGGGVPVVHERHGLLGKLMGGTTVTIPAGHYHEGQGGSVPGPVASWSDSAPAMPSASGIYGASDPDAGHASLMGPNAPAMNYGAPAMSYGAPAMGGLMAPPVEPGAPVPIGVMQTNYAADAPMPDGPMGGPSMMPPMPGMTGPSSMPDPAIQAWHTMGLGDDDAPRRQGALGKMLGISGISHWNENRRMKRAMRQSQRNGAYAPGMSEMPAWAVGGR